MNWIWKLKTGLGRWAEKQSRNEVRQGCWDLIILPAPPPENLGWHNGHSLSSQRQQRWPSEAGCCPTLLKITLVGKKRKTQMKKPPSHKSSQDWWIRTKKRVNQIRPKSPDSPFTLIWKRGVRRPNTAPQKALVDETIPTQRKGEGVTSSPLSQSREPCGEAKQQPQVTTLS